MKEPQEYQFKTKPFAHQLECWRRSREQEAFAILMEMGCGKTFVTINEAAWQWDQGLIDSLVVIAPKGVYRNWVGEVEQHLPDHIQRTVAWWSADLKAEEKRALKLLSGPESAGTLRILLVNVEALSTEKGFDFLDKFLVSHVSHLAIDEATTIKNHRSARTKAVIKLGHFAKYRRILSGDIAANSPMDIYAPYDFLGSHILGHSSFFTFQRRFCNLVKMRIPGRPVHRQPNKVAGYRNLDELRKVIEPYSFIVKKEDCLDLPPKVYQVRDVQMSAPQKAMYEQMKKEAIAEIERSITAPGSLVDVPFELLSGADVVAPDVIDDLDPRRFSSASIVLTQLLRLQQICCGFVKTDDGVEHPISTDSAGRPVNPLLEALLETIEQVDGKVIIWANFRYSIKEIAAALREAYGETSTVTYYGDTSDGDREWAKARFQTDPTCRFFVANQSTGGRGLTLTAASAVLYYSNDFDAEKRNQSEDRAHRIGTTACVLYIDFVFRGTVIEKVLEALRSKRSLAQIVTASTWREVLAA